MAKKCTNPQEYIQKPLFFTTVQNARLNVNDIPKTAETYKYDKTIRFYPASVFEGTYILDLIDSSKLYKLNLFQSDIISINGQEEFQFQGSIEAYIKDIKKHQIHNTVKYIVEFVDYNNNIFKVNYTPIGLYEALNKVSTNYTPFTLNTLLINNTGRIFLVHQLLNSSSIDSYYSLYDLERDRYSNVTITMLNRDDFSVIDDETKRHTTMLKLKYFNKRIAKAKYFVSESRYYILIDKVLYTCDHGYIDDRSRVRSIKDTEDLINYVKLNKLKLVSANKHKELEEEEIKQFAEIERRREFISNTLEASHPGNYEIQSVYKDSHLRNNIIIHYPELTIKNSEGMTHNITNLFIIIQTSLTFRIREIRGTRSTITKAEELSNYTHSHIDGWISPFCLGDSSLKALRYELSDEYQDESFEMLLYQLDALSIWESKEGGPHRYMKDVKNSVTDMLEPFSLRRPREFMKKIFNELEKYTPEEIDTVLLTYTGKGLPYYTMDTSSPLLYDILKTINFPMVIINHEGSESSYKEYLKEIEDIKNKMKVQKVKIIKETGYTYKGNPINVTVTPENKHNVKEEQEQVIPEYSKNGLSAIKGLFKKEFTSFIETSDFI